jgi:hypothetical protein
LARRGGDDARAELEWLPCVNSRLTLEVAWDMPPRAGHAEHSRAKSDSYPSDDDDDKLSPLIEVIDRGTASGSACACASLSPSAAQR